MREPKRFTAWFEQGRKNLIGEFETLAVAIALKLWAKLVTSSQVMIYIDNEGAKFCLDSRLLRLICNFSDLPDGWRSSWTIFTSSLGTAVFLRQSNLSDYPSRKIRHQLLPDSNRIPEGEVALVFNESLEVCGKPHKHGWGPWLNEA